MIQYIGIDELPWKRQTKKILGGAYLVRPMASKNDVRKIEVINAWAGVPAVGEKKMAVLFRWADSSLVEDISKILNDYEFYSIPFG